MLSKSENDNSFEDYLGNNIFCVFSRQSLPPSTNRMGEGETELLPAQKKFALLEAL